MALIMLPCDLPWWPAVIKQLDKAASARNSDDLINVMQRLHDMCNISLDEEDERDSDLFSKLATFLDKDLDLTEREQVFTKTIPQMVERAKALKSTKPPQGLYFSLQQQGDSVEYSYAFVSSLIANAFFSTYPKRTTKTHPTLRDFNFTNFFRHLYKEAQKAKLKSIFHYYNYLETEHALDGHLIISRQVMMSKQWLTIEDWLESNVPLCPLTIRHEGRLERIEAETKVLQVCFANARIGGGVLDDDVTQEAVHIATHPEMLVAILSVEALEDNEVLIIEGVRHVSRINDVRHKVIFESISKPNVVTVCCIDPEDYSRLPLTQFEEDNILREMNKSLLGFRQRHISSSLMDPIKANLEAETDLTSRRLSPIGESFNSTPSETENEDNVFITYNYPKKNEQFTQDEYHKLENIMEIHTEPNSKSVRPLSPYKTCNDASCINQRNRFIVLGSSGEILPITRKSLGQMSIYSSCNSQSTDSFHSAKEIINQESEEDEQNLIKNDSTQLDTPEKRETFAQRLKDALKRENTAIGMTSDTSGESSYAVDISISGSHVGDQDIKVKRGGSRGFVLRNETVDEEFLNESLEAEQKWLGRFRQNQGPIFQRKDTNASSKYSFSTEYNSDFCSELEEVYEQLSKWLEDPIVTDENRELDPRDRAVMRFADSLLKRALSESFAGVSVQDGEPQPFIDTNDINHRHKLALAVRSLSLELARQKTRRQQSLPYENSPQGGLLPVATGNWGCGTRLKGDPQLKLVIQWLASSLANVPRLIYYTSGNPNLSKLDTVSRVLMDRHWSVGNLTTATLKYAIQILEEQGEGKNSLFEEIIGMDKSSP